MKKCIFLDRDGVINRERGDYTWRIEDFEILPEVFEFCKRALQNDFLLIVITNQGGIAKGRYTKEDYLKCETHMLELFNKEIINITEVYYSPHHQGFGLSLDRKPDSLMLEKAIAKFDIDKSKSYFVGDSPRDKEAGEKVGVESFIIKPNSSLMQLEKEIF